MPANHNFAYCHDGTAQITIRTRKFITNRLLNRRQFVVDVLHPFRPNVSRAELAENLAVAYGTDASRVVLFGFRTRFGGQRSIGFGLIYDDEASQMKSEFRNRLVKSGLRPHIAQRNQQWRSHFKNVAKRFRGREAGVQRAKSRKIK